MKAAANTTYGTPDVLKMAEVARPDVSEDQILVEVRASVVTQGDRRLRAADYPGISVVFGRLFTGLTSPRHPVGGTMFAGRVVEVGANVTRFAVGADVFGSVMHGAYASHLVVKEDEAIAKMPTGLDYGEAAAVPYGAVTAVVFLRDMAKVQRGERVLVVGASGGVGRFAVQVAAALGAEVTGVCSRDHDAVRSLGAKHVIDYTVEDFTENGERYDVILDTIEGNNFARYRGSLRETGRYLSVYMTLRLLFESAWTALGSGPRAKTGVALGNAALMDEVRELVESGEIRPVIAERFAFERIVDAHEHLESGRPFGSVVVDLSLAT